jgi:signal transduction histidine kinase
VRDARQASSPWAVLLQRFGGITGVMTCFAFLYALLTWLGYLFKESINEPTIMWPAVGLLLAALWVSERKYWPAFLAIHFLVELGIAALLQQPFVAGFALLFAVANAMDAVVGAVIARWLVKDLMQVRALQALQFVLAAAVGAIAGALLGAWVNTAGVYSALGYLHQVQIWATGNWLGSMVVAPVAFFWAVPVRSAYPDLQLKSRIEPAILTLLVVAFAWYVFQAAAGGAASLLQLPVMLTSLLIYAAYRLPPRWSGLLAMVTAFICAELASRRMGPFVVVDPFIRTVQIQTFLATLVVLSLVLSIALAEKRITMSRLRDSEYRYRNFIELSTEAVWRVELTQPMPVTLSVELQIEWLHAYATVAECSHSFGEIDPAGAADSSRAWRTDVPWSAIYEKHLKKAGEQSFSMDGLRFSTNLQGRAHTFLTSFSAVVQEGFLTRIWGVARDVTELAELNARLLREQERLKTYARQIVTAEENARRATAVDLHDGIGQSLVGMAMTLEVARSEAGPHVKLLIDEVQARLRDVQERTRHVISDLSPPGLYELGLAPALQWLCVSALGHDGLHVELDSQVNESAIKLETRILVFKLVRELLRNVVRHAGVRAATVTVRGNAQQLCVEVGDQGKGFEWQMDMFGVRSGGFGLWSIADRVHEFGGTFQVDTAPGRGSRFELIFPLVAGGVLQTPASGTDMSEQLA